MKILLLGGTGTLSRAALQYCLDKGHDVTIMNRGRNNAHVPSNVHIVLGDFYVLGTFKDSFSTQYDVVVDFLSRAPQDIERVYPFFYSRCTQYILISTACVYRRASLDFPIKEDSPKPNKDWSYNVEKYNCECKLKELYQELKKDGQSCFYTIVRPYVTYDQERIPYGIGPAYKYHRILLERIKHGKPMFVWGKGDTRITLTNTKDFAVGLIGLFMNKEAVNTDFHITSNFVYTWKEVLELLYRKLGNEPNIVSCTTEEISAIWPEFRGMLLGDRTLDAIFDNSKIKKAVPELSFSVDLNRGIDEIIAYYDALESFNYDYIFEAKIDRLLSCKVKSCSFIQYNKAPYKSIIKYLIFRYMNDMRAHKVCDALKL